MFTVKYEVEIGWRLYFNNKVWGIFGWPTEWDCVRELKNRGFPECAKELEKFLMSI